MVYHRLEWDPGQSSDIAKRQERTGEIWGRAPAYGVQPCVKAYLGALRSWERGVEFETDVSPDPGGPPTVVTWSGPREGVDVDGDYAKIRVQVLRNTQT